MTERDQKTIRIAGIFLVIYLICFFGYKSLKGGESGGEDYATLVKRAQALQEEVREQENKVLLFEKLSAASKLDPRKIKKETLVADASAAIQSAAQSGGIQMGPVRETPGRSSNSRELSTFQIEGTGPVPAAMGLLYKLQTLGFPLLIESVQFSPAQNRPGQLKVNLTVILLNYDQFKEGPNA
jgi:hypothetical protein